MDFNLGFCPHPFQIMQNRISLDHLHRIFWDWRSVLLRLPMKYFLQVYEYCCYELPIICENLARTPITLVPPVHGTWLGSILVTLTMRKWLDHSCVGLNVIIARSHIIWIENYLICYDSISNKEHHASNQKRFCFDWYCETSSVMYDNFYNFDNV